MSVTSALYSGISGLAANGEAMSVIGNNIANVNTTGFKQSRMLFSDVLSSSISNGSQVGRGVQIQTVDNIFNQGSFESTESDTDLAIQGDSFFVLENGMGRFYTRAGGFQFDKDKILVNPEGYQVLGYGIDQVSGQSNGVLSPIDLTNFASNPPKMSSKISVITNLDSGESLVGTTSSTKTSAITFANVLSTADSPATVGPVNVYDDAGNANSTTFTFTYNAVPNNWTVSAAITGATPSPVTGTLDLGGATPVYTPTSPATTPQGVTLNNSTQPLNFNFSGVTQAGAGASTMSASADGAANTAPWDPNNPVVSSNYSTSQTVYDSQGLEHTASIYFRKTGANNWEWHAIIPGAVSGSPVDGRFVFAADGTLSSSEIWNGSSYVPSASNPSSVTFGGGVTPAQSLTFDFNTGISTQYSSPSISSASQDGYAQGSLVKIGIDDKGFVNGSYSNGQNMKLAQVALARFSSPMGLNKAGGSLFEESITSGQSQLSTASSPGFGKLLSNSLEQSNVDMAAQFVKMITTQRGYSANSKTITTTDEMMQELINLKR